jgi:hypothetical protein
METGYFTTKEKAKIDSVFKKKPPYMRRGAIQSGTVTVRPFWAAVTPPW